MPEIQGQEMQGEPLNWDYTPESPSQSALELIWDINLNGDYYFDAVGDGWGVGAFQTFDRG